MGKADEISSINAIFQRLRREFGVGDHGKLSDDLDNIAPERCSIFVDHLEAVTCRSTSSFESKTAKHIMDAYRKWGSRLFAQNIERSIPRTNNSIEQFIRKIRRNVRKRCGNNTTGSTITLTGEKMAVSQNIAIPEYRNIVFDSEDMESVASAVARYRKRVKKPVISRSRIEKPVYLGTKMILSDTLNQNPYTEEMMSIAYSSRWK